MLAFAREPVLRILSTLEQIELHPQPTFEQGAIVSKGLVLHAPVQVMSAPESPPPSYLLAAESLLGCLHQMTGDYVWVRDDPENDGCFVWNTTESRSIADNPLLRLEPIARPARFEAEPALTLPWWVASKFGELAFESGKYEKRLPLRLDENGLFASDGHRLYRITIPNWSGAFDLEEKRLAALLRSSDPNGSVHFYRGFDTEEKPILIACTDAGVAWGAETAFPNYEEMYQRELQTPVAAVLDTTLEDLQRVVEEARHHRLVFAAQGERMTIGEAVPPGTAYVQAQVETALPIYQVKTALTLFPPGAVRAELRGWDRPLRLLGPGVEVMIMPLRPEEVVGGKRRKSARKSEAL